jgi:hypothetical protein
MLSDLLTMIDMKPLYFAINSFITSFPNDKLLPIANSKVALRLGTLALTLHHDADVTLTIDMISSIMKCLENSSDVSSQELLIGGISVAIGCTFRCRPACFDSATRLYALGVSLLNRNRCREDLGEERKDRSIGVHLTDIMCCTMNDGQQFWLMLDLITASISETGPPYASFASWQRRPLSLSDQCTGLLICLSLLHMSVKSPQASSDDSGRALTFLRSLLYTYPRLASRAVPSIIDAARVCLDMRTSPTKTQTLLESLEIVSTKCIVSDAHGAHLSWLFLSSLVTDEMPSPIRSTIIRLLPGMCSGNKRLFRRVINVIGKSMLAQ